MKCLIFLFLIHLVCPSLYLITKLSSSNERGANKVGSNMKIFFYQNTPNGTKMRKGLSFDLNLTIYHKNTVIETPFKLFKRVHSPNVPS